MDSRCREHDSIKGGLNQRRKEYGSRRYYLRAGHCSRSHWHSWGARPAVLSIPYNTRRYYELSRHCFSGSVSAQPLNARFDSPHRLTTHFLTRYYRLTVRSSTNLEEQKGKKGKKPFRSRLLSGKQTRNRSYTSICIELQKQKE